MQTPPKKSLWDQPGLQALLEPSPSLLWLLQLLHSPLRSLQSPHCHRQTLVPDETRIQGGASLELPLPAQTHTNIYMTHTNTDTDACTHKGTRAAPVIPSWTLWTQLPAAPEARKGQTALAQPESLSLSLPIPEKPCSPYVPEMQKRFYLLKCSPSGTPGSSCHSSPQNRLWLCEAKRACLGPDLEASMANLENVLGPGVCVLGGWCVRADS